LILLSDLTHKTILMYNTNKNHKEGRELQLKRK